jgi:integrase
MAKQRLTVHKVERLATAGRYYDNDRAAKGLLLQVAPSGSKSWIMRYQKNGRQRALGLGSFPLITLEEARKKAVAARLLLLQGQDPNDTKRAARRDTETITFQEAAEKYFAAHEAEWSSRVHRRQFLNSLRNHVFDRIGKMPIDQIETPHVLKVLEPVWETTTETATRIRSRIEAVLDWAKVRGYRSGDNPAIWKGHLDHLLGKPGKIAKVTNHPCLPFAQINEFVIELRKRAGTAARALEFLILTATRTGDVRGALWSEIDLTAKTWTIPAERMKAKKEHCVPLVESAIELLRSLPRENNNPFVFIAPTPGRGLASMAMNTLLKRMKQQIATVHGFRATFKTWASEMTNFQSDVIEMALAHSVGSKVEQAYQRGTMFAKRRALLDAWSAYIDRPATAATVVPFERRA